MVTPAQVGRLANQHPNTIRNWSEHYGEFLSPAARGEEGSRLYTPGDVEVIRTIAALRRSGMAPEQIRERLAHPGIPPVVDVEPEPPQNGTASPYIEERSTAIQSIYNPLQPRLERLEGIVDHNIERRLAGIEEHLRRVGEQRERDLRDQMWWNRLEGMVMGLVLALCLLGLAWFLVIGELL